ncbi:hypothetical protein BON22_2748 [Cyberlindnera fabianii]|uniref:1,3-beta-glucan synthase n=1 Tax=Cyberlindnera fabianii TaxID=36022 RepID=A0A1V2L9Z2_CYBFA|nr:hypothetical protein BON22_2748 [Cyberlindnera fabianii]
MAPFNSHCDPRPRDSEQGISAQNEERADDTFENADSAIRELLPPTDEAQTREVLESVAQALAERALPKAGEGDPYNYAVNGFETDNADGPFDKEGMPIRWSTAMKLLHTPAEANIYQEDHRYQNWSSSVQSVLSIQQIREIFGDLKFVFGFQELSVKNIFDHLMVQLDSRASRMPTDAALVSLHASYIGGDDSNYKKWYFAAQLDLDEEVGFANMKLQGEAYKRNKKIAKKRNIDIKAAQNRAVEQDMYFEANIVDIGSKYDGVDKSALHSIADKKWRVRMNSMSHREYVQDLALYLLIWGEASQVRFLPECLCFVFKCARDYYRNLLKTRLMRGAQQLPVPPDEVGGARRNDPSMVEAKEDGAVEGLFLDDIVTPLYRFLRAQVYDVTPSGKLMKKEVDHKLIIGYDDVNQLFWYPEGIERITILPGNQRLVDVPLVERYKCLAHANWEKAFFKTYKESRTWFHVATNFNRIWIIHFASYWLFTTFNSPTLYTKDYDQRWDNPPLQQVRLTVIALVGFLCTVIQIVATISEWTFIPRHWPGSPQLLKRLFWLCIIGFLNFAPTVFILGFFGLETHSNTAVWVAWVQFAFALLTCVYFSFCPLSKLFAFGERKGKKKRYASSEIFTASFPQLTGRSYWFSVLLWWVIFIAKYLESYFFLTLSIRDPIRVLSIMSMDRCVGDVWLGTFLCRHQAHLTLGLIYLTELVLFFLDTYLWYIICNCFFSMGLSFALGISIMTPWKNIFSRLPKRIYTKIIASSDMEIKYKPKILVSQVWNAIIISMYREHLLPVDMVQKLLYHQAPAENDGARKSTLKSPNFFIAHDDATFKSSEFFPPKSEAQRRVSFFAQSLSTPMPEPMSVDAMPAFTVLIPHYKEKILLSLREIIKENSVDSRVSLLEYLKHLFPSEWECFVADTRQMAENDGTLKKDPVKFDTTRKISAVSSTYTATASEREDDQLDTLPRDVASGDSAMSVGSMIPEPFEKSQETLDFEADVMQFRKGKRRWFVRKPNKRDPPSTPTPLPVGSHEPNTKSVIQLPDEKARLKSYQDLPFSCIGFKDTNEEYVLRTRIWASLRSQTLYRTASGFMNYVRALKLLFRIENPDIVLYHLDNNWALEQDLHAMSTRKFRMVVSMQRLQDFNLDERLDYLFLLRAFPEICVAYISKEMNGDGEPVYYSCLVDGYCKFDNDWNRIPIYKIRLSGNPILGDGKSDNQNHLLIFYRGEYIQVVDSNQDNYLEECMKIRSVLSEFEELDVPPHSPYSPTASLNTSAPVAIVGAREYIFSENIGVLGDVAAGKEQTFGTLFARTLAEIGGKLHYGHPDFLNAIFMTTRGGISKAQRRLHLNEDIFAGMNAMVRGGRIKHCDYYQCGKGRDLGFTSILNFTSKIGSGMGEQLLSREYYYLGTQLPLDRFLSFYYAHPGFHINNLFITLSVQLFMIVLVNLGALKSETIICQYNKDVPYTDLQEPLGCYMIQPVLNWVTIFIFSVFLVFFIAFVPLIIQELTERGLWKALSRFAHHILSLSPFFEVFVCQIYSKSLIVDVMFGDAQYIASGRGFAMHRLPFLELYSTFTLQSIYTGARLFLLLLFASITIWQPALLWFWISLVSMCFAPFMFNPHQFSFQDFFIDYRHFIHWLSRGHVSTHERSWSTYAKRRRGRITGYQRNNSIGTRKARRRDIYLSELVIPTIATMFLLSAYSFVNSQNGVKEVPATNSLLRLVVLVLLPLIADMAIILLIGFFAFVTGQVLPIQRTQLSKGAFLATVAHTLAVLVHLMWFELVWLLEGFSFQRAIVCLICVISINEIMFSFITMFLLGREPVSTSTSNLWWTGLWFWEVTLEDGNHDVPLNVFREFPCKVMEMSQFAMDFTLGHLILFVQLPFALFPLTDRFHTLVLFWMTPNSHGARRPLRMSQRKRRRKQCMRYLVLFSLVFACFTVLLAVPLVMLRQIPDVSSTYVNEYVVFEGLIQPSGQWNNDTGVNATLFANITKGTMPVFKTNAW